ncbi:MAG: fused MFS/spermidine synthase [Candidatus Woykebacteria bacterium]
MIFLEKTLWEGSSPYNGKVKVVKSSRGVRLVAQGYVQSCTLDKNGNAGFYWDSFTQDLPPLSKNSKILILGLAAGTSAKVFTNKFGPITIHGVEIDPLIVEIGKKYFYLTEPNLKVFIENAQEFVKNFKTKYDVICVDLFHGYKSPKFLLESEFLDNVKKGLTKNGVIIINKICNDHQEDVDFVESVGKVFPVNQILRSRGDIYQQNVLFYGSRQ